MVMTSRTASMRSTTDGFGGDPARCRNASLANGLRSPNSIKPGHAFLRQFYGESNGI